MNPLDIYDTLRQMHRLLKDLDYERMSNVAQNAIDAVDSTLYLAEGVFCREEELWDED